METYKGEPNEEMYQLWMAHKAKKEEMHTRAYREKNKERVNAWKRAYALKLRTESQERRSCVVGYQNHGTTCRQPGGNIDVHTDVIGSG